MTVAERTYIEAEQQLSEALADYAGKWVAIGNHAVIADADTLEELLAKIEEKTDEVEGIHQVPEGDPAALFF